jgi:C4-dicarboxylate-specific signal transduction histidine kinase
MDVVRVTEVNRAAVALFGGRRAADLLQSVRYFFVAAPHMIRHIVIAHFEGRRNHSEQARILTLDGQIRDVVFTVTFPVPPEQLDSSFVTIQDITERMHMETQLRQLQEDHAHAARISTLGELATSIAHEVKQPLSAIITNAETSLRWLARDDVNVPKIRQLTARIASSAHSAVDIVQRIQSLAAKGESERTPLDMGEVVEKALFFVRHDIGVHQIDLSIDTAGQLPKILGDRVQLQQVIVNLLVNSIQAIAQADRPDRYIHLSIEPGDGEALVFSIRDSGPGIAGENLDHVFDSFFTTKEGGLGIGLAICHSIVSAHGGRISVSNVPEGGAHFQFVLPTTP